MEKNAPYSNTAGKVVIGFMLAAVFLVGVAGLTYYTFNRLLNTMGELTQPNQKLNTLNELQGEIIQITQVNQSGIDSDFRVQDSTILSIHQKLQELQLLVEDSIESSYIQSIRTNLDTLIIGYISLYEVKTNLATRNFTQEALRKVEVGIRRRASNIEFQSLSQFNPKDYLFNEVQKDGAANKETNTTVTSKKDDLGQITKEEDKLISYLKELQKQNFKGSPAQNEQTLDNILVNIKEVIKRIYREESTQRQKLAILEASISQDQSMVINTIQGLVGSLQHKALEEANSQNASAIGLTKEMTYFLVALVLFAILGSVLMVYSILKEINVTRKYQENLEVSRQKSEQLARSKQEFLANMSHEIRNPLHVIQGYRSVLEKSKLDNSQQSHLRMIGFASDTLMEIVDEVLDFSKLEAGKLKLDAHSFDPEALFGSLQSFFELQANEKMLDFVWTLDLPEDKWLIGDQLRLKQVLNNLLSNAFKFTSQGSIQVNVQWGDDLLLVEIKDSGIGMSSIELEKVFKEFDQADTSISRKYGGTGLGLAIVQRLVSLMKGDLTVNSQKDEGTSMQVKLPMVTTEPERVIVDIGDIESIDLTGLNILLVDDDKVGIRYLETILNYFGASTMAYPGGTFFRDEFIEEHFDLAILDIQMPEFSGFDVVNRLRTLPPYLALPILAMTANVFVEEREKMLENGFNDIIFKPFQERALIECLGGFFPDHLIRKNNVVENLASESAELFQLSDLSKFCMGDELLLQDIVQELIHETRKDLELLKVYKREDNFDQILEVCHQLGSRLGQIKSSTGQVARKIENSIKLGKKNSLQEILNQLDNEVSILLIALQETIDNSVTKVES
jgi:signal transduction histidine kinase/DNA-binding response OmpR family regulator